MVWRPTLTRAPEVRSLKLGNFVASWLRAGRLLKSADLLWLGNGLSPMDSLPHVSFLACLAFSCLPKSEGAVWLGNGLWPLVLLVVCGGRDVCDEFWLQLACCCGLT